MGVSPPQPAPLSSDVVMLRSRYLGLLLRRTSRWVLPRMQGFSGEAVHNYGRLASGRLMALCRCAALGPLQCLPLPACGPGCFSPTQACRRS